MANPGYDEAYAAARVEQIDADLAASAAEAERLTLLRAQYAPKPKRTSKPKD
jgi:Tfp pilus assembly protein PilE